MKKFARAAVLMVLVFGRPQVQAASLIESIEPDFQEANQSELDRHHVLHSLNGLLSIESWNQFSHQPYSDFDILNSKAHQAQRELENICKETALISNTQPQFAGVKSSERALLKIEQELSGQVNKLTDIARATIVADSIPDLVTAYESLNRETTILSVTNRFSTPAKSGYRDIKLLVELPKTKLVAEVQLHLKDIAIVKNGAEHKIYEEIQNMERLVFVEDRNFTEFEQARITKLRALSQSLYANAWKSYLPTQALA
ncbi:phosphoribosylglycinamide formyltransferase [Aliivibrio logei]|uniref:Phosphoribosylglycinamide formyltransferase n=1 Tax=Aliivibrio logei 5S-186 TaxID=626086 RepID=A0ABX3AXZ4_ALILO|nr:phosphoribosylglycinamide formyltransferase [Aliivibrio logei]OEF16452.1 phosphoribosylglycinamide formyltransferase [Aliivibrio logei 5S-186]